MRIGTLGALVLLTISLNRVSAQQVCGSSDYQQKEWLNNPAVKTMMEKVDGFIRQQQDNPLIQQRGEHQFLITIPVVVHVIYHDASQNVSDADINNQLKLLNQCFRRLNASRDVIAA